MEGVQVGPHSALEHDGLLGDDSQARAHLRGVASGKAVRHCGTRRGTEEWDGALTGAGQWGHVRVQVWRLRTTGVSSAPYRHRAESTHIYIHINIEK